MTQFDTIETATIPIEQTDLLSNYGDIERKSQTGFDPEKLITNPTYVEAGIEKLTALAEALGLEEKIPQAIEIFRGMTTSWGDKKVGDTSGWQSDVSDDLAPFEFSIAFSQGRSVLRVLLEAQGSEPTIQSNWEAGLKLNQYLAEHYNVNLDRFEQIKDLFAPTNPEAKLAMWHSVCFYPDKEPEFKLYLNPQAQRASKAAAVVEESLVRLGFSHAWMGLAEVAAQRGPDRDEFAYFSLDLTADPQARVKVYLRHHDATVEDLEGALSLAQNYVPGDVTEFCQAMTPEHISFTAKPPTTCFSWVEGDNLTPSSATVYLPIGYYVTDDGVVRDRLSLYFRKHSVPLSRYDTALRAFARRSLQERAGMHSYLALSSNSKQQRILVYLNPEVNDNTLIQTKQFRKSLDSIEEVLQYYELHTVEKHPFLQRLQREPVNRQHIWLLCMNVREAVVPHFTRWLINIIARMKDERILSILVKQLNDELGNGDIDGIHRKLYEIMMTAIDDWRVESFTEDLVIPGQEINQCLETIYSDLNPYRGLGTAIVLEVMAKQFDLCLGKEFRKTEVDLSAIQWLIIHEELELDHADESLTIAGFVAEEHLAVTIASAKEARFVSWRFFDRLYRLCYT
jgi:DMATS type aromatic prenyltransferase